MGTDRNQHIDRIVRAAQPLEPELRSRFVEIECGQDTALRREVDRRLADVSARGSFEDSALRLVTVERLAAFDRVQGDYASAAELFELAHAGFVRVFGPDHWRTIDARLRLAEVRALLDQQAAACRIAREATQAIDDKQGSPPQFVIETMRKLLRCMQRFDASPHVHVLVARLERLIARHPGNR